MKGLWNYLWRGAPASSVLWRRSPLLRQIPTGERASDGISGRSSLESTYTGSTSFSESIVKVERGAEEEKVFFSADLTCLALA